MNTKKDDDKSSKVTAPEKVPDASTRKGYKGTRHVTLVSDPPGTGFGLSGVTTKGPKKRSQPVADKPDLVFREVPFLSSLVFTSFDRAIEVDRLHRAIESSKTWGEFGQKIGPKEYKRVRRALRQIDERPADDDAFSSECVPGFCDGDYPPWLAPEMDCYLPTDILKQFGTFESTTLNGSFYKIEIVQREAILEALADAGFTVEERQDLQFW
jgi:hypothetical protein